MMEQSSEEAKTTTPEEVEGTPVSTATEVEATVGRLQSDLKEKTAEVEALNDRLLRLHAEFENYKKRMARERSEFMKFANEALILKFLPILDNVERAVATAKSERDAQGVAEGLDIICRLFQTTLEAWPEKPYPDNLDKRRRIISLRRSKDLRVWTPQEILIRPDGDDKPETEFYLLKAFRYGQGFAGLLMNYVADPNLPRRHSGITHTELIVSEDGLKWLRPVRGTRLKFWTYADPVMLQGKLHFVTQEEGAAMCTLTCERDRLFAACAAEQEGEFTTRPFLWSGERLSLNADASMGWLEASIVDALGHPEPGMQTERLERTNGVELALNLGAVARESGPQAKEIRLHFRLQRAKILALNTGQPKR